MGKTDHSLELSSVLIPVDSVGNLANRGCMATVTKRELVMDLSDQTGMKQQDVAVVVDAMIDMIAKRLEEGNDVVFRKFGSFELRVAKAKVGRNPHKPESTVQIPDRCVIRFRPGKELKDRVASLRPDEFRPS